MALKTITTKSGATLLYENTKKFEGTEFSIGFRCGAKLDGELPGLSHLIEHMLLKGLSKQYEKEFIEFSKKNMYFSNLDTTQESIKTDFFCLNENVKKNIDFVLKTFNNRTFDKKLIAEELNVVKSEMGDNGGDGKLYNEQYIQTPTGSSDDIFEKLSINPPIDGLTILGDYNKLKKSVTPEVIADYLDKYFNKSNLIVSIKSSLPYDTIKTLFDYFESNIPEAKDESFIVEKYIPTYYRPQIIENIVPYDKSSNIELNLLVRAREFESEDINYETAIDIIENKIINGTTALAGLFVNNLRIKNNLCYRAELEYQDLTTVKFKNFKVFPRNGKLKKAIKTTCEFIKNIGQNGIEEELFNEAKESTLAGINSKISPIKIQNSACQNFYDYIFCVPYVDDKKVKKYIEDMTYEEFNDYIKDAYSMPSISLAVSGNFTIADLGNMFLPEINTAAGNTIFGTKTPNSQTTGANIRIFNIPYTKEVARAYEDIEEFFNVQSENQTEFVENNTENKKPENEDIEEEME